MKTLDTKVMQVPIEWSNYHPKLITTKLAIEKYKELPTNLINCFPERLESLLPT